MRNVFLIMKNILKISFRKKGNIFIVIVLPLAGLLLSMLIYNNSGNGSLNIGVSNMDRGKLAGDMVSYVENSGKYKVSLLESGKIKSAISSGDIDCALVIPKGFTDGIYEGSPKTVKIISIKGADSTAYLENSINLFIGNLMSVSSASGKDKALFDKINKDVKNNGITIDTKKTADDKSEKGTTLTAAGYLILFMMLSAGFTANLIIKEKTDRTYYRIFAAPANPYVYILGNILANTVIIIAQIMVIIIGFKIFHVTTYMSDFELFIILMCMGIASIALGVLIVSFTSSSSQAGTLSSLIVTPTCMLGGCFVPLSVMPSQMQRIASFVPQKWAITALESLQGGSSFLNVLPNIAVLLAFGAAFFLIVAYRFKVQRDVGTFV